LLAQRAIVSMEKTMMEGNLVLALGPKAAVEWVWVED
jgi:hypothetical protein